jgi:hypothetical protein
LPGKQELSGFITGECVQLTERELGQLVVGQMSGIQRFENDDLTRPCGFQMVGTRTPNSNQILEIWSNKRR